MKVIGIYKITSPSGKVYIGQSWNIKNRWADYGKKTTKNQRKLFFSFNKYEKKHHLFEVIHELPSDVDQAILDAYEQLYMDLYRACNVTLLNCREGGSKGRLSDETKKRVSDSLKGRTAWNKGLQGAVKMSSETIAIQSAIKKGKKPNNYGKRRSITAIESTRLANAGQKRTDDQKRRISLSRIGIPYHGKNNGKKRTAEMRNRNSEAQKARTDNKGEAHHMAKVTNIIVQEIRDRYVPRKYSARELAKEYGLSKTTVLDIINRKIWKHI